MKKIMKHKKMAELVIGLVVMFIMAAIGFAASGRLKISSKKLEVGQSATVQLNISKLDKAKLKKAKWSSSDKNILKITSKASKGKKKIAIKAVKSGTAYIYLKYGKKTYKVKVTVKKPSKQSNGKETNDRTTEGKKPNDNQPSVQPQPGTTEATTEKVLTDDDYVDPASLIGNLVVTSAWYFDPEGKEKVTEDLVLDKDNTRITIYWIETFEMNGQPVPLDIISKGLVENASWAEVVSNAGSTVLYRDECDGTESRTHEFYVTKKTADHGSAWQYLPEYSSDGKTVVKFSMWNDLDYQLAQELTFDTMRMAWVKSKAGILGVEKDISSFNILPEFKTTDVVAERYYKTHPPAYSHIEESYSFKKINTKVTDDGIKITQKVYQLCKNAKKSISYARRADFIYKDDLTKYNVGYYYRFNDLCDECKAKQAASEEVVTAIRNLKSRVLEEYFIPWAYNGSEPYEAPYQGWANTIYGKGRTPGTCDGFTAINLTGTDDEQGRLVYQYPYGTNPAVYPDGKYLTLQFAGGLVP